MKFLNLNKRNWMQIHTYLSLFFLPAAFIYVLTGALYIFEIRQNAGADIYEFKLDSAPKKGEEAKVIINTLVENNLPLPSDTTLKMMRGTPAMGNIKYSAVIRKDKDGNDVLYVVNRSLYGVLMMMHKSGGTKNDIFGFKLTYFDMIAVSFSISMVIFYLSGLIVTTFCKKNRKVAFSFFAAGLIITILAIYFSV